MSEPECCPMTQDIFQSDRNINSRGYKWQADIAHAYGREATLLSIELKGFIIDSEL